MQAIWLQFLNLIKKMYWMEIKFYWIELNWIQFKFKFNWREIWDTNWYLKRIENMLMTNYDVDWKKATNS
jgi:hypothetical protein